MTEPVAKKPMTDSEIWANVAQQASEGVPVEKAFRDARIAGGKDLFDGRDAESRFQQAYTRMSEEPLFRRHWVLTQKRAELQRDMLGLAWKCDCQSDIEAEELLAIMQDFEKGSAKAAYDLLDATEAFGFETESAELRTRFATIWEKIHNEYVSRTAPTPEPNYSKPAYVEAQQPEVISKL